MPWPRIDGLRTMELGTPGELRQRLNAFVLHGDKRGTAGLLADYDAEGEQLEQPGERLVLVDDDGAEIGRIEVTKVDVVPFAQVSDDFARSEGEGYADRAEWAVAHRRFWQAQGAHVHDTTPVVCIRFELLGSSGSELPPVPV